MRPVALLPGEYVIAAYRPNGVWRWFFLFATFGFYELFRARARLTVTDVRVIRETLMRGTESTYLDALTDVVSTRGMVLTKTSGSGAGRPFVWLSHQRRDEACVTILAARHASWPNAPVLPNR